ncbi:MAG: nucleotidyltransferase domain-containing protein [Sphingobium sp.]
MEASMWQQAFIETVTRSLEDDPRLTALFLSGSFGKGEADAQSDVDLLAIVAPEDQAGFAADWRARLDAIIPVVFWNELTRGGHVINAVGADWQRVDLALAGRDTLGRRAQDSLRPLIDREGLYAAFVPSNAWPGPDTPRVAALIDEFIRILGLLPVVIGREEYETAAWGLELQRLGLFNLLSEEVERADKGGMLAWKRRFPPERLALLAAVPRVQAERQALIDAHLAAAAIFLPHARHLAGKWHVPWPHAFEDAAWRHIERTLGIARPAWATAPLSA